MPSIKIRVGASLDSNVLSMWQPAEKAAARAAQNIARELQRSAQQRVASEAAANRQIERDLSRLEKEKVREVANAAKERERADRQATKAAEREARARTSAEEQAARDKRKALDRETKDVERAAKERTRAEKAALKDIEQELERDRRRKEKAARQALSDARHYDMLQRRRQGESDRKWDGIQSVVTGVAGQALSFGRRIAGDVLRGAGVETDVGSMIGQGVQLESAAVNLSNSGYQAGAKGAAGIRQSPRALIAQVRQVATETAYDPMQAMQGLQAFVAKTGDLKTGRDILKDLAVLSKATGTNLEDMVDAAGDVNNQLGDIPNKGQAISRIMKVIAGQGKLGAVEISDLAVQMAKLAAQAPSFEGGAEKNIETMGALVQLARAEGGASSATQAATSVAAMVNTLKTPARQKQFTAAGVDIVDKKTKLFRDPEEIIADSIRAAGGDSAKWKSMWMNVQGERSASALRNVYLRAGGGDKGMEAVHAEFQKYREAAMSQKEVTESFVASMNTSQAKVQVFNNQMSDVASRLGAVILKPFADLAPTAADMAAAGVKFVEDIAAADERLRGQINATENDARSAESELRANTRYEITPGHQGLTPVYRGDDIDRFNDKASKLQYAAADEDKRVEEMRNDLASGPKTYSEAWRGSGIDLVKFWLGGGEEGRKGREVDLKNEEQHAQKLHAEAMNQSLILRQILGAIETGNARRDDGPKADHSGSAGADAKN